MGVAEKISDSGYLHISMTVASDGPEGAESSHHSVFMVIHLASSARGLPTELCRGLEDVGNISVPMSAGDDTFDASDTYIWFSEKMSAMCSLSHSTSFRAE